MSSYEGWSQLKRNFFDNHCPFYFVGDLGESGPGRCEACGTPIKHHYEIKGVTGKRFVVGVQCSTNLMGDRWKQSKFSSSSNKRWIKDVLSLDISLIDHRELREGDTPQTSQYMLPPRPPKRKQKSMLTVYYGLKEGDLYGMYILTTAFSNKLLCRGTVYADSSLEIAELIKDGVVQDFLSNE